MHPGATPYEAWQAGTNRIRLTTRYAKDVGHHRLCNIGSQLSVRRGLSVMRVAFYVIEEKLAMAGMPIVQARSMNRGTVRRGRLAVDGRKSNIAFG